MEIGLHANENPPEGGRSSGLSYGLDVVRGGSTAPEYQHRIWSKMEPAVRDEKPRPMGIKGRGPIRGRFRLNDRERLGRRLPLDTAAATTRICNLLFQRVSPEHGRDGRDIDAHAIRNDRGFGDLVNRVGRHFPARKLGLGA
jgi:hypothetical protein